MDYRRFFIIGYARTGSNYLLKGLSQVASIRIHHEVFAGHNRTIGKDFGKIWKTVFSKQLRNIRAVGFKSFYYHFSPDEWESVSNEYELAAIHLLRRNRLRTLVSLDIAFATDRWIESTRHAQKFEQPTIQIEPSTILHRIKKMKIMENVARESLSNHPYIELFYEDMVLDPVIEIGKIIRFIGVEGSISPQRIYMRKQNPKSLSGIIENYSEVADVLSGTEYESYLRG